MKHENGKSETKILNCAIYTRKSTDENLNSDFTTLDSQREYCESFIKARGGEGWRAHLTHYNDGGFSGGNIDRPALQQLLDDATKGQFQIVVAYKFDRLSRNTGDFLKILEIFDQYGVSFVSVTQPIDTTSSVGRLMRSILMDFSQFEREMIAERTRDKLDGMARKGKRTGGGPLLGYDIDPENKQFNVNKEEAETVKLAFETYLGSKSLSATAQFLNEKGYRTKEWTPRGPNKKKLGGRKFTKQNIYDLLRSPVYIGKIRHRKEILPGLQEAIISENQHADAQKLLNQNRNGTTGKSFTEETYPYMLRGLVRCSYCKSAMTPHTVVPKHKPKFFYYRCVSTLKMTKVACKVRSIPAKDLEEYVINRLAIISQNKHTLDRIIQKTKGITRRELPQKRDDRRRMLAELSRYENQIKNLIGVLADEGPQSLMRTHVSQEIGELEQKKTTIQETLSRIEKEIGELELKQVDAEIIRTTLGNFIHVFERMPMNRKREMLKLLLEQVVYDYESREIKIGFRPLPEAWNNLTLVEGQVKTNSVNVGKGSEGMDALGERFVNRKEPLGEGNGAQIREDGSLFVDRKETLRD